MARPLHHYFLFICALLLPGITQGCNVTLWPRVRFQHRFGSGPCFFRLPNRPSTSPAEHHWIEVAFSSFQMGRLVNQSCPSGHLKFLEEINGKTSSSSGMFCGRLGDSQTYLTSSKSLTLYANPVLESDHFNAYFDVLSDEALRKRYPEMRNYRTPDDGQQSVMTEGRCDVMLRNCAGVCRLSSPLYPISAYPRNVTCRYRVSFERSDWQVVLGGQPGDRYDVSMHPHCLTDRIVVYEKTPGGDQYQQVAKFCGRGNFPKMIAQTGQVLVEMITSPAGFFHQGFRLSVTHQRKRKSQNHSIVSPCHHSISSTTAGFAQGTILSPRHWFPRNVDCAWTLASSRIWLEISSKSNKPSAINGISGFVGVGGGGGVTTDTNATCHHRMELHRDPERLVICESNSTQIHTLLVRDKVQLHFISNRGSMSGSELDFSIFYMLLPEEAPILPDTVCDRVIEDANGTVDLLGDRLMLRQKQLKCRYRFQASDDYRIRITVRQLVFDPIRQCEPSDDCSGSRRQFDSLMVTDRDLLRCFCQSSANETVVDSASNRVDVVLDLKHIFDQSYKDPNIYRFRIDYAWIEDRCGNPIDDDQGGVIRWRADSGGHQSCTWLIELPDNDRILLKINMAIGKDCRHNYVSLGYHGNASRQVDRLCSMNGEFISPFGLRYLHVQLQAAALPHHRQHLTDPLGSTTTTTSPAAPPPPARFLLRWNVLFRASTEMDPYVEPLESVDNFRCPDSNWSIPDSLVCDGRINCPQQSLYGYLLDEESCTRSYYQDYYPWLMVLVVSFGFSVMISLASVSSHIRKWREEKAPTQE